MKLLVILFILHSDDDLLQKKKVEFHNMIIAVKSAFHEGNKYYPQN